MNADPNQDDVKVLIGRVGDVPDDVQAGICDILDDMKVRVYTRDLFENN